MDKITVVQFFPWTFIKEINEYTAHHANKSQQHTKFYSNLLRKLFSLSLTKERERFERERCSQTDIIMWALHCFLFHTAFSDFKARAIPSMSASTPACTKLSDKFHMLLYTLFGVHALIWPYYHLMDSYIPWDPLPPKKSQFWPSSKSWCSRHNVESGAMPFPIITTGSTHRTETGSSATTIHSQKQERNLPPKSSWHHSLQAIF